MEDSQTDINDSSKKSTRNRPRKYFFFDDFQENDSPKKKVKKPKKDLKLLLKKGLAPTSSYRRDKDLEKYHFCVEIVSKHRKRKPERKIKLDPEELKVIKRLKRTNKPTFNPKLFKESKDRRDILADQQQKIEDEFGKFMVRLPEPKKADTLWDYVIKEMSEVAEYFIQRRKFRIFKAKKLAAGCQIAMKNRKNTEQQRIKEEHLRIVRLADSMAKMVQKEFWKSVQKLDRYQKIQAYQERNMKTQQKRLENFVNKQLKLSSKMADYLQESLDEATEKEDNDKLSNRQFIIHLKKTRQGYAYEKFTYEKEKPSTQKAITNTNNNNAIVAAVAPVNNGATHAMQTESVDDKKDSLQEFANLASQFQPKGFTLNTSEVKIKQPFLIKGQLREYQLIGLNWMVMLYQRKINGILADEMGLGKTLQTISLLAYLACEKGIWGPHLIVVPTSILVNWEIEFKRWCPALKVMTYFGTPKERKQKRLGWSRINSFHVCITSYKLALQDKKIFRRKKWYYMILDEAHNIKNFKSQRWQTLLNFKSKRRLLLTGTPLQNDVGELWSLMHFLMPNIFHSQADFSEWFLVPMQQSMQKNQSINMNIIQQLHSILRPFLLRRLKKDVEKQLPSKTEVLIRCPLSRRQKYLYDEFINKNETKNKIKNQEFLSLMNVVMQLRKVCNHPDLFEPRAIESGFLAGGLRIDVPTICLLHHYHKMQDIYNTEGFNLLQYEQDVPSRHIHDIAVGYIPTLEDLMDAQTRNEAEVEEYLHHFSHKWRKIKCDFRNENMEIAFHTNLRRVFFQRPMYGIATILLIQKMAGFREKEQFLDSYHMIKSLESVIFDLKGWMDNYMISYDRVIAYPMAYNPSKYSMEHDNVQNNMEVALKKDVQNYTDQFHYAYVRQHLMFPDKKFLIYDCGKLNTMMQLLIQLKMQKHKVLIFTQMTKMLDVFEFSLNVFHMTYVRLDGGTRPDTRQKLVERFNQDPKIFCFISSTRSGGIGINLTGADVVIFYDTDWNPAMDKQAQDRCHRIGQTRNVTIYRLISEYTIEENILLKNMQKRKLDEFIFEEGNFTMDFLEKINMKDILGDMLFTENAATEKMDYKQFQKALVQVEDNDDIEAANVAAKEQEEVILEDMKAETAATTKGLEDENPEVDRSMLPPIYCYGLDFIEGMQDGGIMETEPALGTEQENNEEEMEEEEEISEEDDLDFMKESEEDSDEEDDALRTMSAKEAMKTYKDTKKLIYQNYFVNI